MSSRAREPDMNMPQLLAQGRRGIGQKGIPALCLNSGLPDRGGIGQKGIPDLCLNSGLQAMRIRQAEPWDLCPNSGLQAGDKRCRYNRALALNIRRNEYRLHKT